MRIQSIFKTLAKGRSLLLFKEKEFLKKRDVKNKVLISNKNIKNSIKVFTNSLKASF